MKNVLLALCLCAPSLLAQNNVAGDWLVTTDIFGNPLNQKLTLTIEGNKLGGSLAREKLDGTLEGASIHFAAKDEEGHPSQYTGTVSGDTMRGTALLVQANRRMEARFTARRIPPLHQGPPQRYEFKPTHFERQFSQFTPPVLTIYPGDTVHTTTVDAAGIDENGVTRSLGGNPETGPFYVEGVLPGDTLTVHFNHIRLNRDYAISDDFVVSRAVDPQFAVELKDNGKDLRWKLDREHMLGSPEKPGEHMANYTVPLRPMLGCVGVAPGFGSAPPGTGDSGRFGGNMDFSDIVEGATVYLPVAQPGALLYVGDGHAAQGDGELNGDALETSMDVEFTVNVIHGRGAMAPRVESATHIMAMGLAGSLDEAMQESTANLAEWLKQDYNLTPSEIAQVLGSSAEFVISEVADRNAGVVAKLNKQRLAGLVKSPAK